MRSRNNRSDKEDYCNNRNERFPRSNAFQKSRAQFFEENAGGLRDKALDQDEESDEDDEQD